MVSLARKNLLEDIPRFLVAQAGIMFAVSLVTIQTGIFYGFTRSTTQIINNSSADIWLASNSLEHIELTLPIPFTHLNQAQQVAGVKRAEALIVRGAVWRDPLEDISLVRVIGFDPNGQLFIPQNIKQGNLSTLKQPYTVIVDSTNLRALNISGINDIAGVASLPAEVVALTQGNRSVASNPFMFTSLESANSYANSGQTTSLSCKLQSGSNEIKCTNTYINPDRTAAAVPKKLSSADSITYVLIRAKPGQDLQQLQQRLEAALPKTRAYTTAELTKKTQTFWQKRTGIGFILGLGAVVGIIVGAIIVGQILYSSVSDHLKEFGTLKAVGASDLFIYGVIIEQALWMAVIGYGLSMLLCSWVGNWTFTTQGIMILITPLTATGILGITVVMCVGSAIFAIQKVTHVDPASVFKA